MIKSAPPDLNQNHDQHNTSNQPVKVKDGIANYSENSSNASSNAIFSQEFFFVGRYLHDN